jgi:hypothetical protein
MSAPDNLFAALAIRLRALPADRRAAAFTRADCALAASRPVPTVDTDETSPAPFSQRAGDDDHVPDGQWFAAHPTANERLRAPFPGEFRRGVLKKLRKQLRPGQVLVVALRVTRDANGRPHNRVRGILAVDGGNA